ncbi:MAG: hypothetical protein LQ342_000611 [Letrouitia transgressa]|nr:MAG: hypothetical protein LQ342_000611 [Letrouitia transgressa]
MDFGNGVYVHHSNLTPSSAFSPNYTTRFWSNFAEPRFVPQKSGENNGPLYRNDDDEEFELQETDENTGGFNVDDEENCEDDKENNVGFRNKEKATLSWSRPWISNRQQKKLNKEEQGIKLAKDHRAKGVTRWTRFDGFQILLNDVWYQATRHEWHRVRILAEAAREGQYLYEPARGAHELDQTAFHPPDRELDVVVRERRPAILHQWHPIGETPAFKHPGFMNIENAIVIDYADQPIRNWPELPKAISGQCEGLRMEYWRRVNRHITVNDIRARMPKMTSGRTDLKFRELAASSFGNRMDRGRAKGACVAWNRREGTLVKEGQMLKLMPSDVRRRALETNSTAHWRDLNNQEVKQVLEANKGKLSSMNRASWRALSPTTRAQREAAALALKARKWDTNVSATTDDTEMVSRLASESTLGRQSNASRDHHTNSPRNASASDGNLNSSHLLSPRLERPESQIPKRQTRESIEALKSLPHCSLEPTVEVDGESDPENIDIAVSKPEVTNRQHLLVAKQEPRKGKMPPDFMDRSTRKHYGVDFRSRAPANSQEIVILDEALELTRLHFHSLLPDRPIPKTDTSQCYMYQYQQLQIGIDEFHSFPSTPDLDILKPWYEKLGNWKRDNPGITAKLRGLRASSKAKRPASGELENVAKRTFSLL